MRKRFRKDWGDAVKDADLKDDIDKQLRGLRAANTQATAVAWMKDAYLLFERCLREFDGTGRQGLVFVQPPRTQLEVVQTLPPAEPLPFILERQRRLQAASVNRTVVYPEAFQHPGLVSLPKAWTHRDTLRLERAAQAKAAPVQRRGR
jgi:hypothetical protein